MKTATVKEQIKQIPYLGSIAQQLYRCIIGTPPKAFPGSEEYWEERYAAGRDSGAGSYDKFARFKAEILNSFVSEHQISSVIEFGCGDGNQLSLAHYPEYIGFDVSKTVLSECRKRFADDRAKTFKLMGDYSGEKADLTLSLDVVYHLVEDEVFENYMRTLFEASERFVIVYSSDTEENAGYEGTYVWHRKFTSWIKDNFPRWELIGHVPNKYPYEGDHRAGSFADFYIYQRIE